MEVRHLVVAMFAGKKDDISCFAEKVRFGNWKGDSDLIKRCSNISLTEELSVFIIVSPRRETTMDDEQILLELCEYAEQDMLDYIFFYKGKLGKMFRVVKCSLDTETSRIFFEYFKLPEKEASSK